MKKSFIGAAAATLILLSGCSSDNPAETAAEEWAVEQIPGVEIRLSASESASVAVQETRAALLEDDLDIEGLGIFGLAREELDINHSPALSTWFGPSDNWSECILNNVKANKVGNDVKWDDPEAVYFYPISQFFGYDFYGYYPYQLSENLVYEDKRVTANIDIDGTLDLLWGRATKLSDDATGKYAYSARYFRMNAEAYESEPNIPLQHMLTRLVFEVRPVENYMGSGDYSLAAKMEVDTIQVMDAYTHLALTIADLDQLDQDLSTRLQLRDGTTEVLDLLDENGQQFDPVHLSAPAAGTEPVSLPIGESIMVYPQERYTVRIVLRMDGHEGTFITEVPLQLIHEFERGKSYKVTINVHGPREITLGATIENWEEVEGPAIEL